MSALIIIAGLIVGGLGTVDAITLSYGNRWAHVAGLLYTAMVLLLIGIAVVATDEG